MTVLEEIRANVDNKDSFELIDYLIKERFPGRCVVTASLKSKSVTVLKIVADIDPSTPVVFCHARDLYEESRVYRERLVSLLGLTNVTETHGDRAAPADRDADHIECMWVEDPDGGGLVHECVHLNDTLKDKDCWISAVYADDPNQAGRRQRVEPGRPGAADRSACRLGPRGRAGVPAGLRNPPPSASRRQTGQEVRPTGIRQVGYGVLQLLTFLPPLRPARKTP